MKRKLNIVFMGTPEFAVAILDAILQKGYQVSAVVTAPDKPAGRGRKMHQSAVKKYALLKNLPVLQPAKLRDDFFLEALASCHANLFVVVAFRMLPKVVWKMPNYGTFNLHASLLPDYRGAAPINWAIINGETKTGVTTFFIDEKIDTGDMILQKEVSITKDENAGSLHDKLMISGAQLVLDTLGLIESDAVVTLKQKETKSLKPAPKINKETAKINWNDTLYNIYNFIRGLSPYPGAWCYLTNEGVSHNVKIYDVSAEFTTHNLEQGEVLVLRNELKVAHQEGFLNIRELQLPGKRKMKAGDLLNGFRFGTDAVMR